MNSELFLGLREKRRVFYFWKKGQATQEEYRDLVKSCRTQSGHCYKRQQKIIES